MTINMAYDGVGNRKSIATTYANLSQTTSTRYFAYDEMNRQTVVDAVDASLNLGQVGHRVTYDKAGNRTSDTYWGDFGYLANNAWQKGTVRCASSHRPGRRLAPDGLPSLTQHDQAGGAG